MTHGFRPQLGLGPQTLTLGPEIAKYKVYFRSKLLRLTTFMALPEQTGWLKRLKVVTTTKGANSKKPVYQQYGGVIQDLDLDPSYWAWGGRLGLLHLYSAKKDVLSFYNSDST